MPPGTNAIAESLAKITDGGAITIVGGGDSVAAIEQAGLGDKVPNLSLDIILGPETVLYEKLAAEIH